MWLSNPKQQPAAEELGEIGQVTVGGNPAGVYLAGERRNVSIFAPGGYYWRPAPGDAVLVMKAGAERAPCLIGKEETAQRIRLRPGEILLSAHPSAGILLGTDGSIRLFGVISHNGAVVSAPSPETAAYVKTEASQKGGDGG